MSAFTVSTVRGAAGVTSLVCLRPINAAIPAATNNTAPTISAAAQTGSTSDSAAMPAVMNVATPKNASRPATLNKPAPIPACLAASWNSFWASRISSRISRDVCVDNWPINSPIDASAVGLDSTAITYQPLI